MGADDWEAHAMIHEVDEALRRYVRRDAEGQNKGVVLFVGVTEKHGAVVALEVRRIAHAAEFLEQFGVQTRDECHHGQEGQEDFLHQA